MAALPGIVIQSVMPAAAIVPKRKRSLLPPESARKSLVPGMFEQEIEQWFALALRHT